MRADDLTVKSLTKTMYLPLMQKTRKYGI